MILTLTDLTALSGSGSYDGHQEYARRVLDARLTALRAAELYPADEYPAGETPGDYSGGSTPQGDYRKAVAEYADRISAEYENR